VLLTALLVFLFLFFMPTKSNMDIRVVIIEDQKETREILSILISGSKGFYLAGSYGSAEEALEAVPDIIPDVALVDINLPNQSGIECVRQLKRTCRACQFIMCTSLEDTDTIFEALEAGASGYLIKSTEPVKILEAIRDVHQGGSPMSSQIARKVVAHFQTEDKAVPSAEMAKLSSREQEILTYLSKGYRYKEIAALLFLSIETVRKHIHNIYDKLQVSSRTDALNKVMYGTNPTV
jgi:DNA-binding NarL/FixJ family response regulator